jgi:hypothetical protein
MNTAILLVGTLATVAASFATILGVINQRRAKAAVAVAEVAVAQAAATAVKIDGISISVDGRLSQLLATLEDHHIPIPGPIPPEEGA